MKSNTVYYLCIFKPGLLLFPTVNVIGWQLRKNSASIEHKTSDLFVLLLCLFCVCVSGGGCSTLFVSLTWICFFQKMFLKSTISVSTLLPGLLRALA